MARAFASVYECAVDAVFVSAVRDQAEFGAAYMSDELRAALELAPPSKGGAHSSPSADPRDLKRGRVPRRQAAAGTAHAPLL